MNGQRKGVGRACEIYHKVRRHSSRDLLAMSAAVWCEVFPRSVHLRPMAGGLKDLKVWQESVALAVDVIRGLRPHVRRETKAVSDLVMLTAASAAARIAEGYTEYDAAEQKELYRAARRELARLETQLAIAKQAELLEAAPHA